MDAYFLRKLKSFKRDDEAAYYELMDAIELESAKKGDFLVHVGATCTSVAILKKGAVRHFRYDAHGNEFNSWFSFEGDVVCALKSFAEQTPSKEGIEFLEDSEFIIISRKTFDVLTEKHHSVERLYRTTLEEYFIEIEERLYRMQTFSAAEKYAFLIEKNTQLLQRVSQKHIASYLGIKKETLSRIRRQK